MSAVREEAPLATDKKKTLWVMPGYILCSLCLKSFLDPGIDLDNDILQLLGLQFSLSSRLGNHYIVSN
jgi:hypothetical protein